MVMLCLELLFIYKYNRSSIKGDENFIILIIIYNFIKIQPLLDKRGRERFLLSCTSSNFPKYNRSSIKGDENPFQVKYWCLFREKYNRSSIKGDENKFKADSYSAISSEIQPLLDKRGREQKLKASSLTYFQKIQPLLDKRGRELTIIWFLIVENFFKYNRSSIKGDENSRSFNVVAKPFSNTTAPR